MRRIISVLLENVAILRFSQNNLAILRFTKPLPTTPPKYWKDIYQETSWKFCFKTNMRIIIKCTENPEFHSLQYFRA